MIPNVIISRHQNGWLARFEGDDDAGNQVLGQTLSEAVERFSEKHGVKLKMDTSQPLRDMEHGDVRFVVRDE